MQSDFKSSYINI